MKVSITRRSKLDVHLIDIVRKGILMTTDDVRAAATERTGVYWLTETIRDRLDAIAQDGVVRWDKSLARWRAD